MVGYDPGSKIFLFSAECLFAPDVPRAWKHTIYYKKKSKSLLIILLKKYFYSKKKKKITFALKLS